MTELDTGTEKLLVEVDAGVAVITFNQPEKHNALSLAIRSALPGVLGVLQDDPAVRVVVITGAGDKAFVSGADISEFGDLRTSPEARAEYDRSGEAMADAWHALQKPILAMIRGYCIGGGLLMALRADMRIAAEGSQFGIPAARLGLGYAYPGVEILVALVGPAYAAEILLSARRFTAQEARQMGLVNRVVPPAELQSEVMDLARTIADNAPLTVAACKFAITQTQLAREQRDVNRMAEMVERCFRSEDYREGQAAFAGKRPPVSPEVERRVSPAVPVKRRIVWSTVTI